MRIVELINNKNVVARLVVEARRKCNENPAILPSFRPVPLAFVASLAIVLPLPGHDATEG
jgi:hypothetical protein